MAGVIAQEGNLVLVDFGGTPLLNKRQLAHALGVKLRTVENYMAAGMPFERDHKGWCKFDPKEAKAWLAARKTA